MPKRGKSESKMSRNSTSLSKVKICKLEKSDFVSTKVEILETPVKSQSDKKDYRLIRLENGLKALLISDEASLMASGSEMSDSESESEEESSSESDDSRSESEPTEEIDYNEEDADNDERKRQSTPEEGGNKLAAAALSVSVGSFSDPHNIQGLAHFLEHMLFMGSKAYPKENEFDSFIKKKGGQDNAHTDCEDTTFHFEIRERYFDGALSRFANFFIHPLMKSDAIQREREIVDSEFLTSKPDDSSRWDQILALTAKSGYPAQTFTWGNIESLTKISDEELYKELHAFHARHYSAHRMTLAVRSRLSLDKLQALVVKNFTDVPNNNMPPLDFSSYTNTFDTPEFKRMYYVQPMKDSCLVSLTWSLPSKLHLYKCKPGDYVSFIIGDEGHGSLLSYLKKKVWALAIVVGNSATGSELNTMFYLFNIHIRLTRNGMTNLDKVLDAVFAYLALLKKEGPSERIFLELQRIEDTHFRFRQEQTSGDQVEDLSESMAYYEPSDIMTGSGVYFEYNPEEIIKIINGLNAHTVNIKISDSIIEDSLYTEVEPWFGTKYYTKDIHEEAKTRWSNIKPYQEFHYPKENLFLTDDFSLIELGDTVPLHPTKIFSSNVCELWHKLDPIFKLPRAHMYYFFTSPIVFSSVKHAACLDFYVCILCYMLVEELYPARQADLYYNIHTTSTGMMVKISGYNKKLPLLFSSITNIMKKMSENLELNEDIFMALKREQSKLYHNAALRPTKLMKDLQISALVNVSWPTVEKYTIMSTITLADMQIFSREFLASTYVQSIVQGNLSAEIAENTLKEGLHNLEINKSSIFETKPKLRVVQVPKGEQSCCVPSLNKKDNNSIVSNYYQIGPSSIKNECFVDLFLMLIDEPLFDTLRTKQKLGYDVYGQFQDNWGIVGFIVTVHSQADKYTTALLDDKIEEFLNDFDTRTLAKMKNKEFNEIKESLIKLKQCADIHLHQEVLRNWSEIVIDDYIFQRNKLEVEVLKTITLPQIRTWVKKHIRGGSDFRKISFQVIGNKAESVISEIEAAKSSTTEEDRLKQSAIKSNSSENMNGEIRAFELKLMEKNDKTDPPNNYFITNLEEYKRNLFLYPISRTEF